ncbi:MAG: 5-oxoprolinase subunit PxpB [Pseudomonadota bacterium]
MDSLGRSEERRYLPAGDGALVVEFGTEIDRTVSEKVMALDAALAAAPLPGMIETMPSFRSLLVQFDPLVTDATAVETALRALDATPTTATGIGRRWRLPACYHGEFGPDLRDVAQHAGTSVDALIADHSGLWHHVYMIGFLPGAPYMGDMPAPLDLPRRQNPRVRVPQGSVAIAVGLTVIYPVESPGGWNLLGRCPVPLFAPNQSAPALLSPGDQVQFDPVAPERYAEIGAAIAAGEWLAEREAML